MDAQNIFNLILLTLSLATILLTLVSYILYRAKQSSGPSAPSQKLKVDGIYFRRYLPKRHLEELERAAQPARAKAQRDFIIVPKRIVPFFVLTAVIIFFSLFVSNALKRNHTEVAKGHVRYSSDELANVGVEKLDAKSENPFGHHAVLREKKFYFMVPAQKPNAEALAAWRNFLNQNGMSHEVTQLGDADLLILVQGSQLNDMERTQVEHALQSGKTLIATGPTGFFNGQGNPETHDWPSKWLGVKFESSAHPSEYLPAIGASKSAAVSAPPGYLFNWTPTDNRFIATAGPGDAILAYEGDYQGHPHASARMVTHASGPGRSLWLAMDPKNKLDPYAVSLLADALAWAVHEPVARIANWPGNSPGALLLSVDSEDRFSNIASLLKSFQAAKAPATFMVVSHLYEKESSLLPVKDEHVEIGSHSEDHAIFEGQSVDVQFDRIQQSLSEIEALSKSTVHGFRAPEEKSDNATLLAASKLGLNWIATKSFFVRRAPVWVAGGQLLMFPRITLDDFSLIRMNTPPTDIAKLLIEEAKQSYQVGGMDMLNMHSQVFGNDPYPQYVGDALIAIAKLKGWQPTYTEAYHWWNARSKATVEFDAEKKNLTVHNWSNSSLNNAVLLIDDGKNLKKIPVQSLSPGESKVIALSKNGKN